MIQLLQLMQLSDTALPIGSTAHSFGLEGLVEWKAVEATSLEWMMQSFLHEQGLLEAYFCRAAFAACSESREMEPLCRALSAMRPARESREASIVLGRRLLGLCSAIVSTNNAHQLEAAFHKADTHHAIVFGYVSALLKFEEERAVAAFLHQAVSSLVSAAQRLLPVGQKQAVAALWMIKSDIADVVAASRTQDFSTVSSFMPLMEMASMRHPRLETRLFLS
jgi:urease accessory protein